MNGGGECATLLRPVPAPPDRRFWSILFALGIAWRAFISWRMPMPSEDGVNFLWMAQRLAGGDVRAALGEVFPPLTALLVAVPTALGIDPFRGAQLVLGLTTLLAVPFLARTADHLWPRSGRAAAWLWVFAPPALHFGAQVYAEPLFLLVAAAAVDAGVRQRWRALGWLCAVAFWVRPEGALVAVAFALARPRGAVRILLPLALGAVALGLTRSAFGQSLDPVPKLAFNWDRTVLASPSILDSAATFANSAIRLPGLWVEAFGVAGLLAVWGVIRGARRGLRPMAYMLAIGLVLVCVFLPRSRFFLSLLPAVAPFATAGLMALSVRRRPPVLVLAVAVNLALCLRTPEVDRAVERELGEYLAARLAPGERVEGDMTRVVYYAGLRPLPPRRLTPPELIARVTPDEVRFVVLGKRRAPTAEVIDRVGLHFAPSELPPELAASVAERGIVVLERR